MIIFVFERNVYILIFDVTLKSACENYSISIVLKMSISRKSVKKQIMILKKCLTKKRFVSHVSSLSRLKKCISNWTKLVFKDYEVWVCSVKKNKNAMKTFE
jgi:hypothetical protein